jgi:hypothetical protein
MSNRYSMFPFTSSVVPSGTFNLRQLDGVTVQTNTTKSQIIPGGAVDRAHVGLSAANPVVNIDTRDLLSVFTSISPSGALPITNGVARFQKRAECSTFDATAVHETITVPKACIVPMSVQASQADNEGAQLSLGVMALWDGVNAPFTRQTNQDFSAVTTPTFISRYFMGPVYINSVQVPNIERVSIDFGVNYQRKGFNGSPYPTEGSIITRTPTITFTSTAIALDTALSMFARNLAGTISCYFQAGVNGSDRVAYGTGAHVRISATSGEWCTENISVTGNDDGTINLQVMPTAALSVAINSTIP